MTLCEDPADKLFWQAIEALSESIQPVELSLADLLTEDSDELARDLTQPNLMSPNYDTKSPQFIEAVKKLRQAHDLGHPRASNELGLLYFQTTNLKDLSAAKAFFETSAEGRNADGYFNLARIYLSSEYSDEVKAVESLKTAAEISQKYEYFHIQMQMALDNKFSPSTAQSSVLASKRNSKAEMHWKQQFEPLLTQKVQP